VNCNRPHTAEAYRCLTCGTLSGECSNVPNESTWYWRVLSYGRVGPFCSNHCAKEFSMVEPENVFCDGRFTLAEWERLRFLRWKAGHDAVVP